MKKFAWLCLLIFLVAGLAACKPQEQGTINFVSPSFENSKIHEDDARIVPVISSTFTTQKTGYLFLDDILQGQCLIQPQTESTCPSFTLPSVGVHTLSVGITKADGKGLIIKTKVEWAPYTEMDKFAQSIVGGEGKSPSLGYAALIGILVVVSTIILAVVGAALTRGSPQGLAIGAVLGFFTSMILLAIAVFNFASPGISLVVIASIVAIIIVAIIAMVIINATNRGYTMTSPQVTVSGYDGNGRQIQGNFSQPYLGPGDRSPDMSTAVNNFTDKVADNSRRQLQGPQEPRVTIHYLDE